jgi:5-methylcytosine-specific restriction endonuclease McrA
MQAKPTIPCAVADCARPAAARGLCMHHYHRLRTYGDPLGSPPPRPGRRPPVDRICRACGRFLPAVMFRGLYDHCKNCIRVRSHANYLQRRAVDLARAKERVAANRPRLLAYKAAYYAAHREELDAKAKAWVADNREKRREVARNYARRHPDEAAQSRHSRRARMKGARVEPVSMDVLYARDGGICQICKRPVSREAASMDHIIPIVDGGAHALWNVQLTHLTCNLRRNRGYIPAQTRLPI